MNKMLPVRSRWILRAGRDTRVVLRVLWVGLFLKRGFLAALEFSHLLLCLK